MHNHNYNYKSSDVSIVIPSFNFKNSFIKVFQNILSIKGSSRNIISGLIL